MNEKARAPMPLRAATRIVSRFVQAIHMGGWGFCSGFGSTLRQGMEKCSPSKPGYGSRTIMLATCSAASRLMARFCLAGMPKPPSSRRVAPSPIPKSTRPFESRSSVASPSAVRAGWL